MAIRDRFDLVIFDWAGTMVDFGCHAPVSALRAAFAQRAVAISEPLARRDMGKSKEDHVCVRCSRSLPSHKPGKRRAAAALTTRMCAH
jgi:beta-phosphoglucomutase-like phosphatase (HAD superfamily)